MTKTAEQVAADLERCADALWNAEFCLVCIGPQFDAGHIRSPFESDNCDASLIHAPNRFMGFWGNLFNQYSELPPNEGFSVLSRWRDRFYCADDVRKKGKKKAAEEESEVDRAARFMALSSNVGNQLQRLGVPADEVFEPNGNITMWQCSRPVPCCAKVTQLERGFRFAIDDATKEAMPVKYVTMKPNDKARSTVQLIDSDEEELVEMGGGVTKNPFEVKLAPEDRHRRQTQRLQQPRAMALRRSLQPKAVVERFPDLFSSSPLSTESTTGGEGDVAAAPPPTTVPLPANRCSHLFAHVQALDLNALDASQGRFAPVDRERYSKERELFFNSMNKMFITDNPTATNRRKKYITYNISLSIQELGGRSCIDAPLRSKLLAIYPKNGPQIPIVSADTGAVAGMVSPDVAATIELRRALHDNWKQGNRGLFYFANVSPTSSMTEPLHDTIIDVVRIPLLSDNGEPFQLPSKPCRISVVCETVVQTKEMPPEDSKQPASAAGIPEHVVCNTWQLVGTLEPHTFTEVEFKAADVVEYVLVGRKHHGVKIGVPKQTPRQMAYVELQLPSNGEHVRDPLSEGISRVRHTIVPAAAVKPNNNNSTSHRVEADRPPCPVPNHVMCVGCHDVARPFVLMVKAAGGNKDPGFLQSYAGARMKEFKGWEKLMMEALKLDSSRSIVLLEVGADKKMDCSRAYSEKTFKTLKQSKCTFIRICSQDLDSGKGAKAEEANSISITMNPVQGLITLDGLLNERARRGK